MTDPEPETAATARAKAVLEATEARDDQAALESVAWWAGAGPVEGEETDGWASRALEVLDDAGWELHRVAAGPEPTPTTVEDRLTLVRSMYPDVPLQQIDVAARYVATGQVPGTTPGALTPVLAGPELDAAAEALAEWDGQPALDRADVDATVLDTIDAGAALAHAVRALLNAAG